MNTNPRTIAQASRPLVPEGQLKSSSVKAASLSEKARRTGEAGGQRRKILKKESVVFDCVTTLKKIGIFIDCVRERDIHHC